MSDIGNEQTDRMVLQLFLDRLNDQFQVQLDGQSIGLELVEATSLPPATSRTDLGIRQNPFSLIFKSAEGINLPQKAYEVQHETIGSTTMFLVPVGFGEHQAIFN